jgi:hypothetical protein
LKACKTVYAKTAEKNSLFNEIFAGIPFSALISDKTPKTPLGAQTRSTDFHGSHMLSNQAFAYQDRAPA